MRAALLPTPGNPEMLVYWLRNFETWREHVDELVVCINGAPREDIEALRAMVRAVGGRCLLNPQRMGHDGAMRWLLEDTDASLVVLCEDDAYVRHPVAVGASFERIKRGEADIVGSPRHEDYASSQFQEWPRWMTRDKAELRRGLWPTFLFGRRSDLLDNDRLFGDRRWNVGETIVGWRAVTPEDCDFVGIAPDFVHLDTFFGTTFQLRAKGLQIDLVHHVRLFDAAAAEEWIAEDPPWFHVTGLSTFDQLDWPLDQIPDYGPGGGLWTRRLAWWRRIGIDIEPFLARADIDREELQRWDERFEAWAPLGVPA